MSERIRDLVFKIYSDVNDAEKIHQGLTGLVSEYKKKIDQNERGVSFSNKDAFLITYGDSILGVQGEHLRTLDTFLSNELGENISIVHILPFYPYSSDDGFSVIDYNEVNSDFGNWDDIRGIAEKKKIMFDYVVNHISQKSPWFQNYLAGKDGFLNLAHEVDQNIDRSMVVRPRTLPLVHEYEKEDGSKVHLWTTFSKDQVDVNFADPDTVIRMIDVFLSYVEKGASVIRLDAIAYLWKKDGTNCIHLDETHDMVRLMRALLDEVAPKVRIITETNVPHEDNISYFGDDGKEADMVYNFSLPPLMLHMFLACDSTYFNRWVEEKLKTTHDGKLFYNFTSSHDGVGLNGARGIISEIEIMKLVEVVEQNGGRVNFKSNADGSKVPYEMNTSWVDAFKKDGNEVEKAIASYAIKLSLPGVPAFYINSILGDENWIEGMERSGHNRTINRRKFQYNEIAGILKDKNSREAKISNSISRLLSIRRSQEVFDPAGGFRVLDMGQKIFAIVREKADDKLVAITNISNKVQCLDFRNEFGGKVVDLVSSDIFNPEGVDISPFQTLWLKSTRE